jgi:hypothetical protein
MEVTKHSSSATRVNQGKVRIKGQKPLGRFTLVELLLRMRTEHKTGRKEPFLRMT